MTPWLSVLVPVYNVEKYLAECLTSVIEQCDGQIEIIVLDDKSTDDSFQLAKDIAANSNCTIKVIQQERNSGISVVRNQLIAAATGTYLWFVDSDDVIDLSAVAQLQAIVQAHAPDLIMCDYCLWRTEEKSLAKFGEKQHRVASFGGEKKSLQSDPLKLFAGMYETGKLHIWSKIFKRELWAPALAFPEGKYFEDMAVSPLLALNIGSYYYAAEVWVYYRQRPGSILAVPSLKKIEDMTAGVENVLTLWLQKYPAMTSWGHFVFVNYCVKVFYFALKELAKLDAYDDDKVAHYRRLLFKNTRCNKRQLITMYFMRGEFFRLVKLLRYL